MNTKIMILAICSLLINTLSLGMQDQVYRSSSPDYEEATKKIGNLTVYSGPQGFVTPVEINGLVMRLRMAGQKVCYGKFNQQGGGEVHCFHDEFKNEKGLITLAKESTQQYNFSEDSPMLDYFQHVTVQYVVCENVDCANESIISVAEYLRDKGLQLIFAGRDRDDKGMPFGKVVPLLLAKADQVVKRNDPSLPNKLHVLAGAMRCGKTEEQIRLILHHQQMDEKVFVCKDADDTRSATFLTSLWLKVQIPAVSISDPNDIIAHWKQKRFSVLHWDEIQFSKQDPIPAIRTLLDRHVRVIVSGLDMDFKKEPWEYMPALLAIANKVTKPKAICSKCGKWCATLTQRLRGDGTPAHKTDQQKLVDTGSLKEVYESRCRKCHELPE